MLSTGIDLAAALMSVQQISPSDWGYVSKVCLQALLQSGSPNGFPSSSSQEQASADEASDFGLSLSTYPLEETVISSIPSTSSASDAASIRSSFTASLADASATDCRPSFDPANMMRPSVSLLLSSIVSKDPDSPPADSVPTPASPTASTAATDISSDNTVQSPAPSTPPQVHVDILSRSTSDFSVPTVSTQSYYREHTYISPPPAEPLINQCSQVSQSTNVLAQPPFRSSSSNEMVTSIRQPPKQTLRYIPYAVADRPPSLATKILTSSSFSFADQTFSPKPYVPSKCPATSTSNSERQKYVSPRCPSKFLVLISPATQKSVVGKANTNS
ncbi:uncharacterized protein BT62DRAFT_461963 [Guyanagaster necrorhizus]|uniref:Uncharacterized protein n=1 Tax=Guyanagaster necrorhizus TaxID=856835 RepID=A0A9P7VJZ6_9AGAR|nr:uncharacterized protein BT62DRAFT_461963 [Guyanagaster necrorhizus MCA 3950]KAG7441968.1 hypothetical protein BT62DRAFT_461963 [Guyanagaster necrorhizus MCA 3950]